jgi:benzoate membrane transport protein
MTLRNFHLNNLNFTWSTPIFTMPVFSIHILLSVGIPLFIVTMTSQNMPGFAVLNNLGYQPTTSPIIGFMGLVNTLLAPFGCYAISIAAITVAICAGEEADLNRNNRYKAVIFAGFCWLAIAIFGATVVSVLYAFPSEFILAIAGIALFNTIGSSINIALEEEQYREAALITMLVSASGLSLSGIGAAFWGLIAGMVSIVLLNQKQKQK